jgi:hypothetical protein
MPFPLSRSVIPVLLAGCVSVLVSPPAHAAKKWDAQSQTIVSQFPAILPATPSAFGYHDARCARSEVPDTAIHALGCRDRFDVLFQVIEFPSDDAVTRFLATRQVGPANRTTIEDGTEANVLAGRCQDVACFVVTFEDPGRANYMFLVAQAGVTVSELIEQWWPKADFTSGRTA